MIPYNIKCSLYILKDVGNLGQGDTQTAQQGQAQSLDIAVRLPYPPRRPDYLHQAVEVAVTDILRK